MLKRGDSLISNENSIKIIGLKKTHPLFKKIEARLESLYEKSPANSLIRLKIEPRKSSYLVELKINSYNNVFNSKKASHELFQAFLLAKEDIEIQLLDWKRKRFSQELEKSITTGTYSVA